MNITCTICNDKRYLICERSDGRKAVERCDACAPQWSDAHAAYVARMNGIACEAKYPCYLTVREWSRIGQWLGGQPIIGEVGLIEPPNRRPWYSYVVLPQPNPVTR